MEEERWQDTLFVWRGKVDGKKWSGVWVGSSLCSVPSVDSFDAEKKNTFVCTLDKEGHWRCSYKLDGKAHNDRPISFWETHDNKFLVSRSSNEFGHFVMFGEKDGESGIMTMSRRYLEDFDDRIEMPFEQLCRLSREEVIANHFNAKKMKKEAEKSS